MLRDYRIHIGERATLLRADVAVIRCNLPRELGLAGANPAYATALSELVEALKFDPAYVDEIAAFGDVV